MLESFTETIAQILCFIEDFKFWKKKKARRKFEKENNLPKKIMISPLSIILLIFTVFILIASLFFFKNPGKSVTTDKISEIESILEQEKKALGTYPEKLNIIVRNNPLRRNITIDYWNNEFYYEKTKNGLDYILISNGKDGVFNTEDDIKRNKIEQ